MVALVASLSLAACATAPPTTTSADADLAGSHWRLEQLQSPSDGVVKPAAGAVYEMTFAPDGSLSMQLDCNRAAGRWSAQPTGPGRGTLSLSPAAMTRAMCLHGSLDTRIAADSEHVRSYDVEGDRLNLTLEADRGVWTWVRAEP
jgi:heat shock protein HslJ